MSNRKVHTLLKLYDHALSDTLPNKVSSTSTSAQVEMHDCGACESPSELNVLRVCLPLQRRRIGCS